MKATSQTIQQIERALRKVASKYPGGQEDFVLTDIHLQANADSGELLAFNDDDEELTRCVVEQWIGNGEENFYKEITPVLRQCIAGMKDTWEKAGILKPYSFVLVDDDKETVCDLFLVDDETIILKDVIARKKINDAMMLESVVRFTADNIGNMLSTKRIADIMTAEGRKIDQKTVERYLSSLRETFVLYPASRYNIRGKQFLKTLEKYYFIDMGLRRVLLGNRAFDAGRVLENVIYLELLRRHKKVYVGKMDNLEVDFVTMDEDGLTYYQVAATVRDEHTLQRELASLKLIRDQYPKLILTLDEDPDADYDGIKRRNALQWLMEGK